MYVNLHLIQNNYMLDANRDMFLVMMYRIILRKFSKNKYIKILLII